MQDTSKSSDIDEYKSMIDQVKRLGELTGQTDKEALERMEYLVSALEQTKKVRDDMSLIEEIDEAGSAIREGNTDISKIESQSRLESLEIEKDKIYLDSSDRLASLMEGVLGEHEAAKDLRSLAAKVIEGSEEKDVPVNLGSKRRQLNCQEPSSIGAFADTFKVLIELNEEIASIKDSIPRQDVKERKKSLNKLKNLKKKLIRLQKNKP